MRRFKSLVVLSVLYASLVPAVASAQRLPRVTVLVNGGYQPSTKSFDDSFTFRLYQETGRTEVSYPADAGPAFEGGAAIRLWRGLGVGGVLSRFSMESTVSVRSFVPHPLFLQRSREVTGEPAGIDREENAVHIQAQYVLPVTRRFRIVVAGGPSVIDIKQSIVTNVKFTEVYPYDAATFSGVDTRRITGTAAGFNAGADLQWMFTRNVGAGALLRFSRAIVDVNIDGRTIQVDAGGTQVGGGVRIGF